jgi:hypothetical protein
MTAHRQARSCQGNPAAAVKGILPGPVRPPALSGSGPARALPASDNDLRPIVRGRHDGDGIMSLTSFIVLHGGPQEQTHERHERSPAPAGCPLYPCPRRNRSPLPQARVLRPARPGASQVRDAPPGSRRGPPDHGSRSRVRLFPADVLAGAGGLPTLRLAGLDPAASGATPCSQALRRSPGLRAATPGQEPGARSPGPVRVGRGSVGGGRPSAQPRTRSGTLAKKGALTLAAPADDSEEPWVARYEDLRRQVLEEESPPTRRGWGRALVICQGLAAWMKAWPPERCRPPAGASYTDDGCSRGTLPSRVRAAARDAPSGQHDPRHSTGGPFLNSVPQKVTPRPLQRHASLYVRQSTLRQVLENTESSKRH